MGPLPCLPAGGGPPAGEPGMGALPWRPVGGGPPAGDAGRAAPPLDGPSVRKRSRGPADDVGRDAGDTGREAGETGRGVGTSGALPESGTAGIGPDVDGSSWPASP
ncbi:hypothetical protein ACQP2F_34590 [Actinoplanes sp. CA-030573]|uniref:hypothetical protein n=1 Tax=Actinoplanes sp. CA-030573 TaxID=3239898 RepID=UPI003D8C41EA